VKMTHLIHRYRGFLLLFPFMWLAGCTPDEPAAISPSERSASASVAGSSTSPIPPDGPTQAAPAHPSGSTSPLIPPSGVSAGLFAAMPAVQQPAVTVPAPPTLTTARSSAGRKPSLPLPVAVIGSLHAMEKASANGHADSEALAAHRQVELAEDFLEKIAAEPDASNAASANPPAIDEAAYTRLWLKARHDSDEQFRALYGVQAFQGRQIQAAQEDFRQLTE
jgi:hypothetical protein